MPSQLHEALLALFRNRPALAPELLRDALKQDVPNYTEARIESAELNNLQPAEYRADMVVLLYDGRPVLGIVVEVQLSVDDDKRYIWPVYATNLRARFRCPTCLLVVTTKDSTAHWASKPIELGGGNHFLPFVLAPSGVPLITDEMQAKADPELAVLSAMAHGSDPDVRTSLPVAVAAMAAASGLDVDRSLLYSDLVLISLTEAARRALQAMRPANYEFQSDFAKHYIGLGKAEGRAEGKADLVLKLLALRYGAVPDTTHAQVRAADNAQLDAIAERILQAKTLEEALATK